MQNFTDLRKIIGRKQIVYSISELVMFYVNKQPFKKLPAFNFIRKKDSGICFPANFEKILRAPF